MEYEAIIGLELHVQMKTKSKMFSNAPVSFGMKPNSEVVYLDMAFPGSMPVVNKQAVINGIRMCHALHMNIDHELWFDRKNYFYSDLPKGYQITQEKRPLGKNGYLEIKFGEEKKRIGVERLHLEEDTCKQIHERSNTLIDFNRSGIPLIEVVSKPEIRSGLEAAKFVEKIRSIVSFLDISNGKMEEGSLRCDVNISTKRKGENEFGTKVEIKNINTLNNIQKAIEYEYNRQVSILEKGERVAQETRRYDEKEKKTISMRSKMDAVDYKFFFDPNIPPVRLSDDFIKRAIETSNELADEKYVRFIKLGLSDYSASLLINNKDITDYFEKVIKQEANPKLAANWINDNIQSCLNKKKIDIKAFPIKPNKLSELLILLENKKISNKQAKEIFAKMIDDDISPLSLIKEDGVVDEKAIEEVVDNIISSKPSLITDYQNGKDKIKGYIIGQVIQRTNGQADPNKTNEIVLKALQRR